MAINQIFREMFKEQKRQRELEYQKEIIKRAIESQGSSLSDFEEGMDLLEKERYEEAQVFLRMCADENNSQAQYEIGKLLKDGLGIEQNRDEAKKYLMESYKHGFKKSGSVLREMRFEENERIDKLLNENFNNKVSNLGYSIDMPSNWVELESKNKNCFDTVAIDGYDGDVIFNIKMQVFLIEIPDNMASCVSLDRVANNMGCIESVDFNNGNCNGKLICGEGLDGTCNYIFIAKGRRGVYDLRVIVDKHLEPIYEEIIDHIIYSFNIIDI
ncbi:sel1 repeat family protein [Romboutsia weinsteinii]|uniref:Sel1 repeat family protein n=1 Tax=Romboutsia weinsteinii TaxID=2020949 RepID=A0A371J9Q5_9FIRM|nr:sel1 repeat family protein [Romboutsia weinsteinii]RDY29491.1 sel1 repeat family protein [Romboutsia weinsteinii]